MVREHGDSDGGDKKRRLTPNRDKWPSHAIRNRERRVALFSSGAEQLCARRPSQHDLIFNRWGFGERHPTGLALAFNFAGPPGTGKTICAEATASRRSTSIDHRFQRESNTVVSVLLQELERYNGVVIFATNLAANFDPAFERRIRTHVMFEMPGAVEREQIWRVQMHPSRTSLADDVDFRVLAEKHAVSGGDNNAVLKAALAAAAEPGPDAAKHIHQRHLEAGLTDVVAASRVMKQSLFTGEQPRSPSAAQHSYLQCLRSPWRCSGNWSA